MGLSSVVGVFSRYFVVGFLLPVFVALVVYSQIVTSEFLPDIYEEQSPGTQIVILGGVSLILGLVLLGLNYTIMRAFEGYPLMALVAWLTNPNRRQGWRYVGCGFVRAKDIMIERQASRRDTLRALRNESPDESTRAVAAWRLDCNYPRRRKDLLPTSFGNVIRAFELHSNHRWGLDAIAVQPRIAGLLNDNEREIEADARSEVVFFVNLSLLAAILTGVCVVDLVMFRTLIWYKLLALAVPALSAWAFYQASIGAAERWGSTVRAAIDLHRFDMYDKMGVIQPATFTEERVLIGPAISRCFLYGNRLPDALRAEPLSMMEDEK